MTCEQLLKTKGITPAIVRGRQLFYYSPFRKENRPSLTVNTEDDLWYDFGAGIGGNADRLKEVLADIPVVTTIVTPVFKKPSNPIKILHISGIVDRALIAYLIYRKVNIELSRPYIVQITAEIAGRVQNVIGFKNDKGGYEMRSKYLKICNTPKWFTTIGDSKRYECDIFEGFMDFLSYVTMMGEAPPYAIVLNSVSMVGKIAFKEKQLYFFGDNDRAGDETFARLINCQDMRNTYKPYKDLNEYLMREHLCE